MPLAFLLDENQRGLIWHRIQRHNARHEYPLDVVRLGDAADLPLGADDPEILSWAQREGRILVTRDRRTIARYFAAHLAAGHHSPGVFQVRDVPLGDALDFLVCAAYASEPDEWYDHIMFIP